MRDLDVFVWCVCVCVDILEREPAIHAHAFVRLSCRDAAEQAVCNRKRQ